MLRYAAKPPIYFIKCMKFMLFSAFGLKKIIFDI